MNVTRTVVIATMCLLVALTARADFNDGWDAFQHGDYETAIGEWRPLAEQGDANAQLQLGLMYLQGRGVPADFAEAARWLQRSAQEGNNLAQNILGTMYEAGTGVPQDYSEAAKWYDLAAEKGIAHAQSNLGRCYLFGQGVPQDIVAAYMWFDIAAVNGYWAARQQREETAKLMTPSQIAKAERLARDWMDAHQ